jgi:GMP synthase (glutamine-hydrolysing)
MIDRVSSNSNKILIVLHQENSTPGRVGKLLEAMGYELDMRRPRFDDPLPKSLDDHAGAVVFGGPMSANDNDDFVTREINWLNVPLKENKPFLGICLGAQMLVKHLGKQVYSHPEGLIEAGWYPLQSTSEGDKLLKWPKMAYQFHREGFELPDGAILLAQSPSYPNQAFRYGEKAWAVQFHAELTQVMMQRWIVGGAERFTMPGAQVGSQHLKGRLLYDTALLAWLIDFLNLVFGPAPRNLNAEPYQR